MLARQYLKLLCLAICTKSPKWQHNMKVLNLLDLGFQVGSRRPSPYIRQDV